MTLNKTSFFTALLAALGPTAADAQESEITVSKVVLSVRSGANQLASGGTLYRLTDKGRVFTAEVDASGAPDNEIKCRTGDRFEAVAESYFDRPTPPPRRSCNQELVFNFSRAVHADWTTSAQVEQFSEPFVFSELSTRTLQSGESVASLAFSDAAIASTAKLLGDERLDRYVLRDPGQNFKLVFNEDGLAALKEKQKNSGVKVTGQLDAATQSVFLSYPSSVPSNYVKTIPAVNCGRQLGQLICTTGSLPSSSKKLVTLPSVEFKLR